LGLGVRGRAVDELRDPFQRHDLLRGMRAVDFHQRRYVRERGLGDGQLLVPQLAIELPISCRHNIVALPGAQAHYDSLDAHVGTRRALQVLGEWDHDDHARLH